MIVFALTFSVLSWPPQLVEPEAPPALEALPSPQALEEKIRFWEAIYTVHPSDRMVIHDRDYQNIIWRVIELPKDEQGKVDSRAATVLTKEAVADVRERLERLAADATPIDDEDRVILALAGAAERLPGAAGRLRSQRGVADKFEEAMDRCLLWVDRIRQVLIEEGVPPELAALPFIESMYNTAARSSVGAAGIWQIMPSTGRWLGLKVKGHAKTPAEDERLDVLKATRAAARLLKKNYDMLGSWPLAITAYNHGHNGLRRAVTEVGSSDLVQLIASYESPNWGFSSKNFYAGFLAAWRTYLGKRAEREAKLAAAQENPSSASAAGAAPSDVAPSQ